MQKKCTFAIASIALLFAGACGKDVAAPTENIGLPAGNVVLESFEFANIGGGALALVGRTPAGGHVSEQTVEIRTSSGSVLHAALRDPFANHAEYNEVSDDWRAASRARWARLSDEDITVLIAEHDDRVVIGFKESDMEFGVDDNGQSQTSEQTTSQMKNWLRNLGVTIQREFVLVPTISGVMPADVELVGRIRGHDNVDYLEVPLPGTRSSVGTRSTTLLIATVPTSDETGLTVLPGDRVDALYRQPDGSVLTTTIKLDG